MTAATARAAATTTAVTAGTLEGRLVGGGTRGRAFAATRAATIAVTLGRVLAPGAATAVSYDCAGAAARYVTVTVPNDAAGSYLVLCQLALQKG